MSEKDTMLDALRELRCHFTWDLLRVDIDLNDLENRILEEIKFLDTEFNVGIHNTLAYVRHEIGHSEQALECLRTAEDLIQQLPDDQAQIKSLVTWGNYAWIYYHMDRLPEAQTYLDKVEASCKRLSSPFHYKVEHPEIDCEEGWALLKFTNKYYEEAKACFQKALESEPENPEFNTGFAITMYRLDHVGKEHGPSISLEPLRRAITLNPKDTYINVLLALKLQSLKQPEEGEKYLQEALNSMSSYPYILRYAAKFYCIQGCLEKAFPLLETALQYTPSSAILHYQIGLSYRNKLKKIKWSTNYKPQGRDRQDCDSAIQLAIEYFENSVRYNPTFLDSYIELGNMYAEAGDFNKAEENYQKVLNMKQLNDYMRQKIHYNYGSFQEFHRNSEDEALNHYLKGLKIDVKSQFHNKLLTAFEKLTKKRLHKQFLPMPSV